MRSVSLNDASNLHDCLFNLDADSNRKMLAMSLKRNNIVSHEAINGQQAVDIVSQRLESKSDYTAIFMDHTMPIMNGVEAIQHIRKLGYSKLILGLTGNTLNDDVKRMIDAGADMVLSKPLRPNQLKSILQYIEENGNKSDPQLKLVFYGDRLEQVSADRHRHEVDVRTFGTLTSSDATPTAVNSMQLRSPIARPPSPLVTLLPMEEIRPPEDMV